MSLTVHRSPVLDKAVAEVQAMLNNATQEWHAIKRVREILGPHMNGLSLEPWEREAKLRVKMNLAMKRRQEQV